MLLLKNKKAGGGDSRVYRQLLASLESQGLRLCPAEENTNIQQHLTRKQCDTPPAHLQLTGGPVFPMPTGPCGPAGPTSPLEP